MLNASMLVNAPKADGLHLTRLPCLMRSSASGGSDWKGPDCPTPVAQAQQVVTRQQPMQLICKKRLRNFRFCKSVRKLHLRSIYIHFRIGTDTRDSILTSTLVMRASRANIPSNRDDRISTSSVTIHPIEVE
jgi:hypothetical protein